MALSGGAHVLADCIALNIIIKITLPTPGSYVAIFIIKKNYVELLSYGVYFIQNET
jgi:hypothetical protein